MTTPLPANPSMEQLRKQAKELVRAREKQARPLRLSDAQREVAREYGFASWPRLKAYVDRVSAHGPQLAHAFVDDIGYYEERAEGLRSVVASGLANGIAVVRAHHPALAAAPEAEVRAIGAADARLVLAREHGFESWHAFRRHVGGLSESGEPFRLAFTAIESRDRAALATLLDRFPGLVAARGTNGNDLLGLAAGTTRDRAIVRELLARGADPSSANDRGWTALHQAGYSNDVALARQLLEAGARTDVDGHGEGGTPLAAALFWGNVDVATVLAERGDRPAQPADRRRPRPARPDRRARGRRREPRRGRRARRAASTGRTPASRSGQPSGDPQEILDEALVWAAKSDRADVMGRLVELGADVDGDPYRGTALTWAAAERPRRVDRAPARARGRPEPARHVRRPRARPGRHRAAPGGAERPDEGRAGAARRRAPTRRSPTISTSGPPAGWAEHGGPPRGRRSSCAHAVADAAAQAAGARPAWGYDESSDAKAQSLLTPRVAAAPCLLRCLRGHRRAPGPARGPRARRGDRRGRVRRHRARPARIPRPRPRGRRAARRSRARARGLVPAAAPRRARTASRRTWASSRGRSTCSPRPARAASGRSCCSRTPSASPTACATRARSRPTARPGSASAAGACSSTTRTARRSSAASAGFTTSFHPHAGSYIESPREVDALLENMDTGLLGLCFDAGHSAFGGGDPLALLREAGELVNHVHLKDVDLDRLARVHKERKGLEDARSSGVFCELGTGGARVGECLQRAARRRLRRLDRGRAGSRARLRRAVRRRARVGRAQPRVAAGARPVSARETAARLGRLRGLDMLSDARGIFALAAIDHRDALGVAFEQAGFPAPAPERIAELKVTIARALAPHATGLLIDVELGAPAIALRRGRPVRRRRAARGAGLRGRLGRARDDVPARLLARARPHARRDRLQAAAALSPRPRGLGRAPGRGRARGASRAATPRACR